MAEQRPENTEQPEEVGSWVDPDHTPPDDQWHSHAGEPPPQKSHGTTSPAAILAVGAGSFLLIVLTVLATLQYFKRVAQEEKIQKIERWDVGREFQQKQAQWNAVLDSYDWENAQEGVVQIPIEPAIERTVDQYAGGNE